MKETCYVGVTAGGRWAYGTNIPDPIEIDFDIAIAEIAEKFGCSVENAADSLIRNRFASTPARHWHLHGPTVTGDNKADRW